MVRAVLFFHHQGNLRFIGVVNVVFDDELCITKYKSKYKVVSAVFKSAYRNIAMNNGRLKCMVDFTLVGA
jgi:hypothetical protein